MSRTSMLKLGSCLSVAGLISACAGGMASIGVGGSSGGGGIGFFTGGAVAPQSNFGTDTPSTLQARLGLPSATYPLPDGGQRLQYSQMPSGYQVFDYDFDSSGRLIRQDQALRYENFNHIVPGKTREDEILFTFGRPMRVVSVATFDGPIWDYRFSDINNPRIISVHIDRLGIVQRIVYTDIDRLKLFSPN
jgi:hypothetical protein